MQIWPEIQIQTDPDPQPLLYVVAYQKFLLLLST
jgi:hypothetical protein